jgi:Kazal-type serine protease inhibitor domain
MNLFRLCTTALVVSSVAALQGCAVDASDPSEAQSDEQSEEVVDSADQDLSASANYNFFVVTQKDFRKCASPMCGGYFVKRVNRAKTLCADGSYQPQCYVSSIDLSGLGLGASQEADFQERVHNGYALVKATTRSRRFNGQKIGMLRVTEGWDGAVDVKPTSTFYRMADTGLRCVMAPCPQTGVTALNSNDGTQNLLHPNLHQVGAAQEKLDAANNAVLTDEGVLTAGGIALPKCRQGSVGCGPFFSPENFYLRVKKDVIRRACGTRGGIQCAANEYCAFSANAQCGATDMGGSCVRKPEACIMIYQPVCGCDGKTYGNACSAASVGVSVAADGECSK